MAILGAHMSIAGGYFRAVERAKAAGCDCVQIFTKNNNQWRAKEITQADVEAFGRALDEQGIGDPIAHDSYLINLASPDDLLWRKSVDAFRVELERCDQLKIPYLVTHPGAHCGTGDEAGLKRVIAAINEIYGTGNSLQAVTLLETTAGQGSTLGWKFEHLATIMDGAKSPDRLGICVDTCHIFAAGYPIIETRDYKATMKKLDSIVGLNQIKAFHLNDSKRELGSRVDRHAKIGDGHLGLAAFKNLLNDSRFQKVPMYLETPKGMEAGVDLDVINLATLRNLIEN